MAFKMKGNPMKRNFGSALKHTEAEHKAEHEKEKMVAEPVTKDIKGLKTYE